MSEKKPEQNMDETIIASIDDLSIGPKSKEPYLIVVAGTQIGKIYSIDEGELIGGRSADCDIWIEDSTISRKHFRIRRQESACVIQDLNSTNGTFVNNRRIKKPVSLEASDKIQISKDTIIQFDYFDENRKISEQKRYELGVIDPGTNAYNKSYFLQRVADEFSFSLRQNLPLSLLMIDIDFFKQINDTHGHLAGDQVLIDVSTTIKNMIRNEDVYCRYGGEEFVIIMRNTHNQDAVNLADRIRQKIEKTIINYDDQEIKVTISLGAATSFESNYRDYVSMIRDADNYLYEAKGSGRNCVKAACSPNDQKT
ncbi:MAG: GGDEF domain-containing protein [bacterium]|nr:GGDEF domain-containing protein [bacterium]MBU1919086.1 GGDEF domain-containing protein [bacterium]